MYVTEAAEDVNFCLRDHDPRPRRILNGELRLAFLTADTTDTARQVIAMQCLDILDLEGLEVEVIQTQHGHAILQVKAEHEALEEVGSLLDGSDVLRCRSRPQLHHLTLGVHSDLELHMFNQCLQNTVPVLSEWCEAVPGDGDFSILATSGLGEITDLDFVEFYFISIVFLLLDRLELLKLFNVRVIDFHAGCRCLPIFFMPETISSRDFLRFFPCLLLYGTYRTLAYVEKVVSVDDTP